MRWKRKTRLRRPKKPSPKRWERLRKQGDPSWYQAYLRSHHWRRTRKRMVARAGYRCQRCGWEDRNKDRKRGTRLHVHHKSYARVGHERLSDLEVLCYRCHKAHHGKK